MTRFHVRAEDVQVDTDEGRFCLIVFDIDGGEAQIDIHDCVLDFYARVKGGIGPYAAEAESARRAVRAGVSLKTYMGAAEDDDDSGYALDDPKSPGFHDRAANHWDTREGK